MIENLIEKTKQRIISLYDNAGADKDIGQEILFLSQSLNELQKHRDYVERKFNAEHQADQVQRQQVTGWRKS